MEIVHTNLIVKRVKVTEGWECDLWSEWDYLTKSGTMQATVTHSI